MQTRVIAIVLFLGGLTSAFAQAAQGTVYQLTTVAGSDLVGDGGIAQAAQLAQPEGLVVDLAGNVYIADAADHRVRKVTVAGVISTVAGNGHPGFSGDNGPASAAQLNQPYGLAMDAVGNLYIADLGNERVRRIDATGIITTVVGNGEAGCNGDGGPATSAQMLSPRNLALDAAGNLYVSEFYGHRVRRITPDGTISTIAGTGIAGYSGDAGPATVAQLTMPAGLALDVSGDLYIADTGNYCIRKVQGGLISTFWKPSLPKPQLHGITTDSAGNLYVPVADSDVYQLPPGGLATPAFKTPLGGVVDVAMSAGYLYYSQGRSVQRIGSVPGNPAYQAISTVAGDGTFGFTGDGSGALLAVLNAPVGLAFNNGAIYIADQGNQRIRQVAADGTVSTVAGNGQATYTGDGLPAIGTALYNPVAVAFDPTGNLYIADSQNQRVRRVDPSGVITTVAGCDPSSPTCIGFGGDGGSAALTPLDFPQGVLADLSGNLYIADTKHDRVIRVNPDQTINTVAGTGTPGYTGDSGSESLPELQGPTGLALDTNGNLYIADTQNNRVRMLTTGGVISTIAGMGTGGFSGDGGPALTATLSLPRAVAVDANNNIYIADSGNNVIRMVTPDGKIATIAGTGQASYNGESGPALQMALYNPCALALDGQGNLLVADTGNNRVRKLTSSQTVLPPQQLLSVTLANSASLVAGPLAPGEIFSIFGQGLGPDTAVAGAFDPSGLLSTALGGTQVLFGNTPAPLFYVQSQQINAQVPYEMAGQTSVQLQVIYQGLSLGTMQVSLQDANPALFTLNSGSGQVVAVNENGNINSDAHPAPRGSIVVLYATGEGQTMPAGVTGQPAQAPFGKPLLNVSLTIAEISANILYAGRAPGFVGLMQINVQVPSGFVPTGDLPVVLMVGTYQSPAGVTIAVE